MTSTMQYIAILIGAEIDLKLLAHCFVHDPCKVACSELPDIGNGQFYHLVSTTLQMEPEYERKVVANIGESEKEIHLDSTWERANDVAERLLNTMHGAARLIRSQYKPVCISSMHKFDLDGRWVGSSSSGSSGDNWRSYSLPAERTGLTELAREWALKGLDDDAVSLALSIYGTQPLSWAMLYMVFEVIRDDIGENLSNLISSSRLRAFKNAANNARDLRSGPRHAEATSVDQSTLISIHEGENVVRHLLNIWLGDKIGKVMC